MIWPAKLQDRKWSIDDYKMDMKTLNTKPYYLLLSLLLILPTKVSSIDLFGSKKNEQIIWEINRNVYIKLVDQEKSAKVPNDHPIELDQEQIRKSLGLLLIRETEDSDTEDEPRLVLNRSQMSLLSKNLVRAFAKANPEQDVVFSLKKTKDRFLGLKTDQYFDAGRAFYKDGKLHLIIGDYDRAREEGYENVYDPTHVGIVKYTFDHGRRSKSSKKFRESIVLSEGVETNKRPDWFIIDLDIAAQTADEQRRHRERGELASKRKELRQILGDEGVSGVSAQEQAKINKERRDMRAEMARMRKEMREMSTNSGGSLEKRLATLKGLKDKGLITDKEYELKRQGILKDI